MDKKIGSILRDARNNKKLTQKQLAKLINAKHNSISDWELDKNRPDMDKLDLLIKTLDIDSNLIFERNIKRIAEADANTLVNIIMNNEKIQNVIPSLNELKDGDMNIVLDLIKRLKG